MYCCDCLNWEPDAPEIGYCSHPKTAEFEAYAAACARAETSVDATDCPGFQWINAPAGPVLGVLPSRLVWPPMHYPENSEHEYLAYLIWCEQQAQDDAVVEPIRDRYWQAYCDGDRPLAERLWQEANQARIRLAEQAQRKHDIVRWLYTDQELRAEGKTYPDTYEARGWEQCSDETGIDF